MRDWRVDLGNGYWYDNKPDYHDVDETFIAKIEAKYNVRYVAEWNTIARDGRAINQPRMVFWSDRAHPEGSNWMGMYEHDPYYYVCDAITASQLPIWCMVSDSKQVLFSKHRHDFRSSYDGSVSVDGGREYTRVLGKIRNESVWLVPQQGELKLVPEAMAKLMLEHK